MNARSPSRVLAQRRHPETSKVHVFESHNIRYAPTRCIDRCHVALSFLPEAG